MIQVKFKNLERSELARNAVEERFQAIIEKFPDLENCKITVSLEMENSPSQAGPDLFRVKALIGGGRFRGNMVQKANANLYIALAEVIDHMLEKLNRYGDKIRVRERKKAREFQRQTERAWSLRTT